MKERAIEEESERKQGKRKDRGWKGKLHDKCPQRRKEEERKTAGGRRDNIEKEEDPKKRSRGREVVDIDKRG